MDRTRILEKLGKAMTATAYVEQVSEDEGYDITDDLKGIRQNISDSIAILTTEKEGQKEAAISFVKGARWWEFYKSKGTMWQSDQAIAAKESGKRYGYEPTLDDLFPFDTFKKICESLAATEPKP